MIAQPTGSDSEGGKRSAPRRMLAAIRAVTGPWTSANGVSWLKLIVLILVLRWAFVELYRIPSSSMEPTLHGDPRFFHGDRVAVNKLVFGPRVPFTTIRLLPLSAPKRWDIVVFNAVDPDAPHKILIKRVVGLPGERVNISDGKVYADGAALAPPEKLREILNYMTGVRLSKTEVIRTLLYIAKSNVLPATLEVSGPEGAQFLDDVLRLHLRLKEVDVESMGSEEVLSFEDYVAPSSLEVVDAWWAANSGVNDRFKYGIREDDEYALVPEGHYFLLGDNSGNSVDGRAFGWVPYENLYGRAFAIALPFSRMGDLTGFSSTWWGTVLLYGLPISIVVFELLRGFVVLPWHLEEEMGLEHLRDGDHVLINRITFGLRIPFSSRRFAWRREAGPGEPIAYVAKSGDKDSARVCTGYTAERAIEEDDAEADNKTAELVVHTLEGNERKLTRVARERILGTVMVVYWPPSRWRRVSREQPAAH